MFSKVSYETFSKVWEHSLKNVVEHLLPIDEHSPKIEDCLRISGIFLTQAEISVINRS